MEEFLCKYCGKTVEIPFYEYKKGIRHGCKTRKANADFAALKISSKKAQIKKGVKRKKKAALYPFVVGRYRFESIQDVSDFYGVQTSYAKRLANLNRVYKNKNSAREGCIIVVNLNLYQTRKDAIKGEGITDKRLSELLAESVDCWYVLCPVIDSIDSEDIYETRSKW